jgi:preprotein translocase subunit SecA
MLGEGVAEMGGLHIIGTERHESRRIDNQLRGRAGRQGDPGSSQFYLSLEDELMRRFGSENIMGMMDRLGFEEDQPIESALITRAVENAQKKVEGNNFDVRKVVLQYDDVMNQQRKIIYAQRLEVIESEDMHALTENMMMPVVEKIVEAHCTDDLVPEEWDLDAVVDYANATFLKDDQVDKDMLWGKEKEEIIEYLQGLVRNNLQEREVELGEEAMREFEKVIVLRSVDAKWMDHIDAMDQLRTGIHLRGYGGTDPLREYQFITKAQVQVNIEREMVAEGHAVDPDEEEVEPTRQAKASNQVGRNEQCPCGSGKKYKHCHGA